MATRHRSITNDLDPLAQIDDLERQIVLAKEQTWLWNGASAEEIALFLPAVKAQARAICDQIRSEYLARSGQR